MDATTFSVKIRKSLGEPREIVVLPTAHQSD